MSQQHTTAGGKRVLFARPWYEMPENQRRLASWSKTLLHGKYDRALDITFSQNIPTGQCLQAVDRKNGQVVHRAVTINPNPTYEDRNGDPQPMFTDPTDQYRAAQALIAHEQGHAARTTRYDAEPGTALNDVLNMLEDERMERDLVKLGVPVSWLFHGRAGVFTGLGRRCWQIWREETDHTRRNTQLAEGDRFAALLSAVLHARWGLRYGSREEFYHDAFDDNAAAMAAWENDVCPLVEQAWEAESTADAEDYARQILAVLGIPEQTSNGRLPENPFGACPEGRAAPREARVTLRQVTKGSPKPGQTRMPGKPSKGNPTSKPEPANGSETEESPAGDGKPTAGQPSGSKPQKSPGKKADGKQKAGQEPGSESGEDGDGNQSGKDSKGSQSGQPGGESGEDGDGDLSGETAKGSQSGQPGGESGEDGDGDQSGDGSQGSQSGQSGDEPGEGDGEGDQSGDGSQGSQSGQSGDEPGEGDGEGDQSGDGSQGSQSGQSGDEPGEGDGEGDQSGDGSQGSQSSQSGDEPGEGDGEGDLSGETAKGSPSGQPGDDSGEDGDGDQSGDGSQGSQSGQEPGSESGEGDGSQGSQSGQSGDEPGEGDGDDQSGGGSQGGQSDQSGDEPGEGDGDDPAGSSSQGGQSGQSGNEPGEGDGDDPAGSGSQGGQSGQSGDEPGEGDGGSAANASDSETGGEPGDDGGAGEDSVESGDGSIADGAAPNTDVDTAHHGVGGSAETSDVSETPRAVEDTDPDAYDILSGLPEGDPSVDPMYQPALDPGWEGTLYDDPAHGMNPVDYRDIIADARRQVANPLIAVLAEPPQAIIQRRSSSRGRYNPMADLRTWGDKPQTFDMVSEGRGLTVDDLVIDASGSNQMREAAIRLALLGYYLAAQECGIDVAVTVTGNHYEEKSPQFPHYQVLVEHGDDPEKAMCMLRGFQARFGTEWLYQGLTVRLERLKASRAPNRRLIVLTDAFLGVGGTKYTNPDGYAVVHGQSADKNYQTDWGNCYQLLRQIPEEIMVIPVLLRERPHLDNHETFCLGLVRRLFPARYPLLSCTIGSLPRALADALLSANSL